MDCNCRCCLLQIPKWAIEHEFTKIDNSNQFIKDGEVNLISGKSYNEYKKNYFKNLNNTENDDKITVDNLLHKLNVDIKNYDLTKPNNIQENVSKLLKLNELPKVVNKADFENIKGNEIVRYLHDIKNITANDAYENTLYGEIQYSNILNSQFGRGIYFGDKTENEELSFLYGKNEGKAINAKISEKAKILEFNSKISFIKDVNERIEKLPKELQMIYKKECSLLYMLDGYDGIKINGKNYYCIYNRKVLIVKDGK